MTFMVSEGTLLGAVRDQESFVGCHRGLSPHWGWMCFQDIIPYTADLDIYVPREGANIAANDGF